MIPSKPPRASDVRRPSSARGTQDTRPHDRTRPIFCLTERTPAPVRSRLPRDTFASKGFHSYFAANRACRMQDHTRATLFRRLGRTVKNTMPAVGLLRVLSGRVAFFRLENQHYRGIDVQTVKSVMFYRALRHRLSGGPDLPTLSRIRGFRALWPANGATRRKSRR